MQVRQTDVAGKMPNPTTLTFTLDNTIATPTVALTNDTGIADLITKDGALTFSDPASDVTRSFTVDSDPASGSYTAPTTDGSHTVVVTDTDTAGNTSNASITFTLDNTITTPTVALTNDTGSSAIDLITSNGGLTLTGIELGATVEYSIDGGATWTGSFTAAEGPNTVQVRQTDVAGNMCSRPP